MHQEQSARRISWIAVFAYVILCGLLWIASRG